MASGDHHELPNFIGNLGLNSSQNVVLMQDDETNTSGGLYETMEEHQEGTSQSESPTLSQESQDSCHTEEAVAKGYMNLEVRKTLKRPDSFGSSRMQCYKMSADPRGLALVIDIENYENNVQEKRHGSEVDQKNLTHMFQGLGFSVRVVKDPIKKEFWELLDSFAKDATHEKADMMILSVLSHGREGGIITKSGQEINVEDIYQRFNNQNCPSLKGKPKFFIIQACRGDTTDKSYASDTLLQRNLRRSRGDHLNEDFESPLARRRRYRYGTDTDAQPFGGSHDEPRDVVERAGPTWEDMIIAYSTIPGFAAIRDTSKGSWFVQSLVEVFSYHAADNELIDLLRMTSERLSKFSNERNEKQTCNIEMRHLYKRIYFLPGFFENSHLFDRSHAALRRSRSTPPQSPRRRDAEIQLE